MMDFLQTNLILKIILRRKVFNVTQSLVDTLLQNPNGNFFFIHTAWYFVTASTEKFLCWPYGQWQTKVFKKFDTYDFQLSFQQLLLLLWFRFLSWCKIWFKFLWTIRFQRKIFRCENLNQLLNCLTTQQGDWTKFNLNYFVDYLTLLNRLPLLTVVFYSST